MLREPDEASTFLGTDQTFLCICVFADALPAVWEAFSQGENYSSFRTQLILPPSPRMPSPAQPLSQAPGRMRAKGIAALGLP